MKKILSITLISALTIAISTGCSSTGEGVETPSSSEVTRDAKIPKEALFVNIENNKKVIKIIKEAAQKTGWKITDFKSNEVIAEKTQNDDTVSSSIKIADGFIDFENNEVTMDLREAIADVVKNSSEEH